MKNGDFDRIIETQVLAVAATEKVVASVALSFPIALSRWMSSPDGKNRCLFATNSYSDLLGLAPAQIMADGVAALDRVLHPDDAQNRIDAWNRMQTQQTTRTSFRVKRPDGTWKTLDINYFVPERFADGSFVFQTLIQDISAEVDAKNALEKSEAERQRMAIRSVEAQRLESLGHLAGGIAHDFNNLLGAIWGFTEFAAEDADDPVNVRQHLSRVLLAAQRGKVLVDQILAFAKSSQPEIEDCNLSTIALDTESLLIPSIPSSSRIDVRVAGGDLYVKGDSGRIGQVLLNLCINAHDSYKNQPGRVQITVQKTSVSQDISGRFKERVQAGLKVGIETWVDADGNNYLMEGGISNPDACVSLIVEDWGSGIDRQILPQIFTPFFTTKERGQGTGFGLSIIHGIILSHDGAVVIRTKPGIGTRVEIILPQSGNPVVQPGSQNKAKANTQAGLPPVKILVVDDDQEFADMVGVFLTRNLACPVVFGNPIEAWETFRQSPQSWGAVVTDQTMPDMLGTSLIRAIRGLRPTIPCVLCSGYADVIDNADVQALQISSVLRKPFKLDVFKDILADILVKP